MLNILYMKSNDKKLKRNHNSILLEEYCNNRFYGPLLVGLSYSKAPFSLISFTLEDLKGIEKINSRSMANKNSLTDDFVPECLMGNIMLN